jgi:hypothetical protein
MRPRALRGRADVQADEPRPCRRCMAAVSLSVDATVCTMHRSQVIRCLCIGSSPDVRAHGDTHGSTALLRSPSDLPEPPVQRISRLYLDSPGMMQAEALLNRNRDRIA